nr:MAG TPA: hypothetical protein [Bacteriophage sp.]
MKQLGKVLKRNQMPIILLEERLRTYRTGLTKLITL